MKSKYPYLTAGKLAKTHGLNKRTLHYYDEAGIFSPEYKGENGYRYYSFEQSIELENILALRELDMSIEEIKSYMQHPNSEAFCKLATDKIKEIDETICRLKQLKTILQQKKNTLISCNEIYHGKLEIVELPEQHLLMTPIPVSYDTHDSLMSDMESILEHLKNTLNIGGYRKSCGSYISLEKIKNGDFHHYDGIFTHMNTKRKDLCTKPEGKYLRSFCVGDWDRIPEVYESMLNYAREYKLALSGNAYEFGLNEFAISSEDEYISQIEILIKPCNQDSTKTD